MIHTPKTPNGTLMRDPSQVTTVKIKRCDDGVPDDALVSKDVEIARLRIQLKRTEEELKDAQQDADRLREQRNDAETALSEMQELTIIRKPQDMVNALDSFDHFEKVEAYGVVVTYMRRWGIDKVSPE